MDGTLLTDEKRLPEDLWDVVSELNKHGIMFCIASGRQLFTLHKIFEKCTNEILFLAENGTYVVKGDEVLHKNVIPNEDALQLIETGRNIEGANIILCCTNGAYVESNDEKFLETARSYYFKLDVVDDLTKVSDDILKVTMCDFNNSEKNSYTHFQKFREQFKVVVSGEIWLDVMNLSANKGTALKMMQEKLHISLEETAVFGDFLNDLEMLERGKYSFAMKNSHPQIIEAASFVTEFDNNESGVTATIKKIILDGRLD
jgi:hypothetical protein